MQLTKPKSHGKGPYGYFQRVLMDGARPFNHRPLTCGLLGQTGVSTVQQMNASHVPPATFIYPNHPSLFDAPTGMMSVNGSTRILSVQERPGTDVAEAKQEILQQQIPLASITALKQTAEQKDTADQKQESMTVLSWLERAQTRHPVLMHEDRWNDIESISQSGLDLLVPKPDRSDKDALKKIKSKQQGLEPVQGRGSVLTKMNEERRHNIVHSDDVISDNLIAKTITRLPSVNVDVPHTAQTQDRGQKKQTDAVVSKDKQPQSSHRTSPALVSIEQAKLYKTNTKGTEKSISRDNKDNIRSIYTETQSHPLENKPQFRQNTISQVARVKKIQQALQVQRENLNQPPTHEQRAEYSAERKIPNKVSPQVRQQVVVINPPAGGAIGRHAFLERSYLGRLGPRSYK